MTARPEMIFPARQECSPQPITVHFHGGTKASTILNDEDIEQFNEQGAESDRIGGRHFAPIDTFEELLEKTISEPPKPHWCWIGGIYLFTQAISGFELADTTGD